MFMRAVHPGEILKDELDELDITPTEFARQIDVPPNRISQIIAGKRAVTGDSALRFGHWFGTEPQFWLNLQSAFDILPRLKTEDSHFTEPCLFTFTCKQDLQFLHGLTPPVRRPKHCALR
jgi:addiction module HigA family antidote